jgi:hypothetical protein
VVVVVFLIAVTSSTLGVSAFIEQAVKAQNLTTNETYPAGNMTGTDDDSGSISARRDLVGRYP